MTVPNPANQYYVRQLNPIKGLWTSIHALTHNAPPDPSMTLSTMAAGAVGSLNAQGNLILGLGTPTRQNAAMPLFLKDDGAQPGVLGDAGNMVGYPTTVSSTSSASSVIGNFTTLVATGAWELETTQFNSTTVYNVSDLLTIDTTGGAVAGNLNSLSGVAKNCGSPGVTVCGVVSKPVSVNALGQNVLRFWSTFIPPASAT